MSFKKADLPKNCPNKPREDGMAKIKHIALKVEDQEKTAEFYKKTFGMTEAWRGPVREDGKRAIYLTDGYINMAVLPARGEREGIDHFGFQVEDMEGTVSTATEAGAKGGSTKKPRDGRFAEVGVHDPAGQLVDVSVHGWKA
jgi:catechol 2,3-dioxygenase-like lactoylglutathione lyase family enzyme